MPPCRPSRAGPPACADLLRLVSIPVIALALYFVAITAGLIVDADSAEIAVLASRGAGAGHIVLLHLLEWMPLAVPVAALAPLPAAAFARLMGAADGFLRSRPGPPLPVAVSWDAYASAGAAADVVAALVPVVADRGRGPPAVLARGGPALRRSRTAAFTLVVGMPRGLRNCRRGLRCCVLRPRWGRPASVRVPMEVTKLVASQIRLRTSTPPPVAAAPKA